MGNSKFIIAILSIAIFAVAAFGQAEVQTVTVAGTSGSVAEKPAGTIRIGVVAPKMQLGQEASTAEAASAVREAIADYLKGPTVDVVVIDAKSATNAAIEAAQKGCDFILFSGVSKKTKTSLFGTLIKAAVPVVAGQVPGGSAVAETGASNLKHAAAQGGKDFVNNAIAAKFGAKDEITLDFAVTGVDAKSAVAKGSSSAKVNSDGEDVLTTLIEKVAEKVLQAAVKK